MFPLTAPLDLLPILYLGFIETCRIVYQPEVIPEYLAISERHNHNIPQFIIGEISQYLVQFLDIICTQSEIMRFRAQTEISSREVIWPQILFKVIYLRRLGFSCFRACS